MTLDRPRLADAVGRLRPRRVARRMHDERTSPVAGTIGCVAMHGSCSAKSTTTRSSTDSGWPPCSARSRRGGALRSRWSSSTGTSQADIDRARRERPGDAQHVIDVAAPSWNRAGGGWNWVFYRPFVELALRHDVPLLAANLSNADTARIVRGGYAAVFSAAEIAALGLDRPVAPEVQAAQEREIDAGHCHALPRSMWPRMAQAQSARDAVMADVLRRAARGGGVVLLAGNGHVRRDLGVPRWLGTCEDQGIRRRLPRDRRRLDARHGLRCGGANRSGGTRRSLCRVQETQRRARLTRHPEVALAIRLMVTSPHRVRSESRDLRHGCPARQRSASPI